MKGIMERVKHALRLRKEKPGSITIPPGSPMSSIIDALRAQGSWGFAKEKNTSERLLSYTGYVMSCVFARAQRDAVARYTLKDKRDGRVLTEDDAPIPYAFFKRPNPVMSEYYFKVLLSIWLNLAGKAPVLKIRNAAGAPVMQWPIMPNRITVKYDPVDWVRYDYLNDDGSTTRIPGKDLIFYRWPHPTKLFDGLGPLEGASLFHDTDIMLWAFQREMFTNGPTASWTLNFPESVNLDPEHAQLIAESFADIVSDKGNVAHPVILDRGAKAEKFPFTNKGLEVPTINEEIKERIRSAFHVSKTILGEVPGESRANVEGAEYGFYRFTESYHRLLDEENERTVLPEWDERYTGDYESVVPEDLERKLREEDQDLRSKVLTINEVRERRGLEPVDWGKQPWGSFNEVQLQGSAEESASEPNEIIEQPVEVAEEPAATGDVQQTALNGAQVTALQGIMESVASGTLSPEAAKVLIALAFPLFSEADIAKMIDATKVKEPSAETSGPVFTGEVTELTKAELRTMLGPKGSFGYVYREIPTDDAPEGLPVVMQYHLERDSNRRRAFSNRFVSLQTPHEKAFLKKLRSLFAEEEEEVIAKLKAKVPRFLEQQAGWSRKRNEAELSKRSIADDIADLGKNAEKYANELNPILLMIYTANGKQAAQDVGSNFEVNASAIEMIGNHLENSTNEIIKTSSEKIKRELKEGFLAGEGIGELVQRIRDLYSMFSKSRAELIARTETVAAANRGAIDSYEQAGIEKKEWIATLDGHAREEHERADGQTVLLNEPFKVGNVEMQYPGASGAPASQVCNCRCTVAAVITEDTE